MTFVAACPACTRAVGGGEICECGYLYIDTGGSAHTARGEGWENAPNIPVRVEEPPAPEPVYPKEEEEEEEQA